MGVVRWSMVVYYVHAAERRDGRHPPLCHDEATRQQELHSTSHDSDIGSLQAETMQQVDICTRGCESTVCELLINMTVRCRRKAVPNVCMHCEQFLIFIKQIFGT